mmetsp:Transcript_20692/g.47720  ORF Transcript_20692/g.47720 Transcript_20692/m.47720 type:complete len:206 (+) Transcript_20692:427-1044(+)
MQQRQLCRRPKEELLPSNELRKQIVSLIVVRARKHACAAEPEAQRGLVAWQRRRCWQRPLLVLVEQRRHVVESKEASRPQLVEQSSRVPVGGGLAADRAGVVEVLATDSAAFKHLHHRRVASAVRQRLDRPFEQRRRAALRTRQEELCALQLRARSQPWRMRLERLQPTPRGERRPRVHRRPPPKDRLAGSDGGLNPPCICAFAH